MCIRDSTTTATTTRNASTDNGGMDDQVDPDARPKRRTFTAEYKAEILAEHDAYPKGALSLIHISEPTRPY